MRLRERLHAALQSLSRVERHRRTAERDRLAPLEELSPEEAAEVFEMDQLVYQIKTGDFPTIEAETYPEPIGPQLPTVDEKFAAFQADPLTAELPGTPAPDNVLYRDLLAEHAPAMSPETLARLEGPTGLWRLEDLSSAS